MRKMVRWLGLLLLLLPLIASADGMTVRWAAPEGWTAGTPEDAQTAAALLDTDAAELQTALLENGAALLLVSPGGTTVQLNICENDAGSIDFGELGRKQAAMLASTLAQATGEQAEVIQLQLIDTAEDTASAADHCRLWIRLTPADSAYPQTVTWLTERSGLELTVYVSWTSEEEQEKDEETVEEFLGELEIMKEE